MSRALAILKYVPDVLCGLLLVAGVVSGFVRLSLWVCLWEQANGFLGSLQLRVMWGSIWLTYDNHSQLEGWHWDIRWYQVDLSPLRPTPVDPSWAERWLGRLSWEQEAFDDFRLWDALIPIPFLVTLLLPLCIGSFTRFRFPLWSYFAWAALIAAELAFYLR